MSVLKENIQNFGKLKNSFNVILSEGIVEKNEEKKNIFKKYVAAINENEILRIQFLVYNNLETLVETDKARVTTFIYENIGLFSKYTKKEIYEANEFLFSLADLKEQSSDKDVLYENISTLIFTEKKPTTILKRIDAIGNIVDYITNNKPKQVNERIDLPNSLIASVMVEKYNEKYSSLTEQEKEFVKAIIDSDDEKKITIYTDIVRECIDLIDVNLKEEIDLVTKDKLLRVKDKLLNTKTEINEDYVKNVSKLFELKNNLKNNEA